MTYGEAFDTINDVELVLLNRDYDKFQSAIMMALFLLKKEAEKETKKGAKNEVH